MNSKQRRKQSRLEKTLGVNELIAQRMIYEAVMTYIPAIERKYDGKEVQALKKFCNNYIEYINRNI